MVQTVVTDLHTPFQNLFQFPIPVFTGVPGIGLGEGMGQVDKKGGGAAHVGVILGKIPNYAHGTIGVHNNFAVFVLDEVKIVGVAIVKGQDHGACPCGNVDIVGYDIGEADQAVAQVVKALKIVTKIIRGADPDGFWFSDVVVH